MIDVIYIMWLRQIKRYWRSKSRIIGSIGQPLLFLLALGCTFVSSIITVVFLEGLQL